MAEYMHIVVVVVVVDFAQNNSPPFVNQAVHLNRKMLCYVAAGCVCSARAH